jgi:hypothetical protein
MESTTLGFTFFQTVGGWLLENGGILTAAIAGAFGVFADHKTGKKWALLSLAGVLGGMIWGLASSGYESRKQDQQMAQSIQDIDTYVHNTGNQVTDSISANEQQLFQSYLGLPQDKAQQLTVTQANTLLASAVLADKSGKAMTPAQKQNLEIWVYPHAQGLVDFNVVQDRLQQIANTVKLQLDKVHEQNAPANSVWYSGNATLDQAKAVALVVTSAGLDIRQVCPATITTADRVQVGGSVKAQSLPVLTPSQIQNLSAPVCTQ